jgi:hypothetical protein
MQASEVGTNLMQLLGVICFARQISSFRSLFFSLFFAFPCSSPLFLSFKKKNGKTVPLQAWTGPYLSRRLGLPDF